MTKVTGFKGRALGGGERRNDGDGWIYLFASPYMGQIDDKRVCGETSDGEVEGRTRGYFWLFGKWSLALALSLKGERAKRMTVVMRQINFVTRG